jgi:hypothetical protein
LENYTTIQEAINNASNGDVILVSLVIYNEDMFMSLMEQKELFHYAQDYSIIHARLPKALSQEIIQLL